MKKIYKRLLIAVILVYFVVTLISQQKSLSAYKTAEDNYNEQIEEATNEKEDLLATKQNLNSTEYIEEVAREKLNMYLPNERVYIDISK